MQVVSCIHLEFVVDPSSSILNTNTRYRSTQSRLLAIHELTMPTSKRRLSCWPCGSAKEGRNTPPRVVVEDATKDTPNDAVSKLPRSSRPKSQSEHTPSPPAEAIYEPVAPATGLRVPTVGDGYRNRPSENTVRMPPPVTPARSFVSDIGTATSPSTPDLELPQVNNEHTDDDDRNVDEDWENRQWETALERAKKKLSKREIEAMDFSESDTMESVIQYATALHDDQTAKFTVKYRGKEIKVEEKMKNVLVIINTYAPLADTFLGNSSEASKLVWGSFRALLQVRGFNFSRLFHPILSWSEPNAFRSKGLMVISIYLDIRRCLYYQRTPL